MGATLDSIVKVNISLANAAVQQRGFGRPLVIGASNRMGSDLFRVYTGAAGMLTDGFLTTDPEYKAVAKIFSQELSPDDVMVGYTPAAAVAEVVVVTVATATNDFTYTVTINGETAAFLADSSATKAEIATGLIAAINALSGAAAWTAGVITGVTDRFSITSDVAGTPITVSLGTTKLTKPQFNVVQVAVATSSFDYSINIGGKIAAYTSDSSATATEIRDGLLTAIGLLSGTGVTAASLSTDKLTLVADVEATPFSLHVTATKLVVTGSADNATGGISNGLTAILTAGGKSWYALVVSHTRAKADILEGAAWIEAADQDYIYIACSADADVLTGVTSDVASELKALAYLRTAYLWSDDQANFPEAAWLGEELPRQPGSSNYAFKTLIGITGTDPAVLTDNKISILEGKNGNYYMVVGNVGITQTGKMAGGEWIDVIVGRDWLKARIQEAVYTVLVTMPKVPFTDPGIGALVNALRGVLQQGIDNLILNTFNIDVPLAASYTSAQRATRTLPSIPWQGRLAGAINDLVINGNLTA